MKSNNYKHGKSGTNIYNIWSDIKRRCFNEKNKHYKDYGGRGILMQKDWIDDFLAFELYVKSLSGYEKNNIGRGGLSIDRKENDGNYESGNLRWSTSTMQARNRRIMKNNTSGYTGVHYDKERRKYRVTIKLEHKRVYLGIKKDPKEAYQLRIDYIKKHNLKGFEIEFITIKKLE